MATLTITAQRVPKEYRNKRIYHGARAVAIAGVGGGGAGSAYTAGNGITVAVNIISLDTNFIEVVQDEGVKLKYNNITELEVISGGIDIKNILKVGTVQERVTDAGILLGSVLKVDQTNGRVGIGQPTPAYELDVTGDARITSQLGVGGAPLANNALYVTHASNAGFFERVLPGAATTSPYSVINARLKHTSSDIECGPFMYFSLEDSSENPANLGAVGCRRDGADNSGKVEFYTYNAGTRALKMAIAAAGKVSVNNEMDSLDTVFSSGFTGAGWKLAKTGSGGSATYNFEVDNLRVRGSMTVYELILNQIRATNGSLWVSDAAKIETSDIGVTYDYDITVDTDGGNMPIPFAVNDLLRCQQFDGRNVKYYVLQVKVINASAGTMECDNVTGAGVPAIGDALVRMGNTVTAARQNAIYLTASDTNNPYIEVLAGVNSGTASLAGFSKARLGNLTGITDAEFGALSGYGLWSENAYLTGKIVANDGLIAGWEIEDGYINKVITGASTIRIVADKAGLPKGFQFYRSNDDIDPGDVKLVQVGQLHAPGNSVAVGSEYGFQIKKLVTDAPSYADLVYFGDDTAQIAGWNIEPDTIFSGSSKHTSNGYAASGLSLVSDGGIHSKNFYVNTDGEVGVRAKIVKAYKISDIPLIEHNAVAPIQSEEWIKRKTITLYSDVKDNRLMRIYFGLKTENVLGTTYGKIYKNGSPIGTERSTISLDYEYWSEDLVFSKEDDIQLYLKVSDDTYQGFAQNFQVRGDIIAIVDEVDGSIHTP